jgi:membrane-associated phospholipid phosphatase
LTTLALLTDLTNLGDIALLLPVAFALFVWLATSQTWRPAASWAFAIAICIGGTGLLKVLFFVCPPVAALHSPSGHTSLSTLVYGGLGLLVAARGRKWQRIATVATACALVASIAVSRVVLDGHTILETATGIVIGMLALAFFGAVYLSHPRSQASLRPLMLGVAILMVLLHGQQLHAEELVRAIGEYLRSDGLSCR